MMRPGKTPPLPRRTLRRRMVLQRLMGLGMLVLAALAFRVCAGGQTPADRDGTGAVLAAALGLWLLFTKKEIIC